MQTKFLDNNGLLYVWKKLKDIFAKKVELEEVKASIPKKVADLTDASDYAKTSAIPTKVENLTDASDYAKKTDLPKSVADLTGIEDYAKQDQVPKKVAEMPDHTDYVKKTELTEEVKALIGNVKSLDFQLVESLPETGEKAVIYLVANDKGEHDAYDEYIYVNGSFEKIGTTAIDLTGYLKENAIGSITNAEIDALFA